MSKKRVLCWFDAPTTSTGFAQVSKNVLKHLNATDEYTFDIIGINHDGSPYDTEKFPYRIYPAVAPLSSNEKMRSDVYGFQKFLIFAGSGNYDLVYIINDTFIMNVVMPQLLEIQKKMPKEKRFEIIIYYPVDSPLKPEWVKNVIAPVGFPVAYTKYAFNETVKHDASLSARLSVIYHGVEKKTFFPYPKEEVAKIKKEVLGKNHADKFMVLNVGRNQPRKDMHKTFAGFKIFHDKYPNTILFILAQAEDVGGNLVEIAKHYGLEWDKDWVCPTPGSYGANQGYPIEIVNKIYNAADVVVSTNLGEGWGLCLKPETLVYTETGVKSMAELTVFDKVLSSNGTYNRVENIMSRNYEGKLYKITTWLSNTPVQSSADHPFKVLENGEYVWKNAEELKVGDSLLFPKKYNPIDAPTIDTLEILKPHLNSRQIRNIKEKGDTWTIDSNFKKSESYIPRYITLTPEFCRLIGLFLAEGNNSKDGIKFCMNKNETAELQFIANMMKKYFGLTQYENNTAYRGEKYQGRITIYYSSIVSKLFSVWFDKGSRNIKIPPLFLNLNKDCLKELVYGLYLGDGSYSESSYEFMISTTSANLAYATKLLLSRLGVASAVRSSRTEYKVSVSGPSRIRLLKEFGLPYKELDPKHSTERASSNDDFFIFPIKSIEVEDGAWRLMDIQVANTNDFVADNVIVHNCSSEGMAVKRPILITDNTATHEIIGENQERGWFIKCGDTPSNWVCLGAGDNNQVRPSANVEHMAEMLEYIYTHPEEVQAKTDRAFAEVWTWETVCKQWVDLFAKAGKKVDIMRTNHPEMGRNDPCLCGSGKKWKECCI